MNVLPVCAQDDSVAVAKAMVRLRSKLPAEQIAGARALRAIGPPAKDAMPLLVKLLRDDNRSVRFQSAAALQKIGLVDMKVLAGFLDELKTGGDAERRRAADVLGYLRPVLKGVIPALIKAVKDPVAEVRQSAILALGRLSGSDTTLETPQSARTVQELVRMQAFVAVEFMRRSRPSQLNGFRGGMPVVSGNSSGRELSLPGHLWRAIVARVLVEPETDLDTRNRLFCYVARPRYHY